MKERRDINSLIVPKTIFAGRVLSATTDGSELNGIAIDRLDTTQFPNGPPESVTAIIALSATQDSAETLTLAANWQTGPSSTQSWADVGTAFSAAVVITQSGGDGESHAAIRVPLSGVSAQLDQFVRIQLTPTLSDTDDATVAIAAVGIFEAGSVVPGAGSTS